MLEINNNFNNLKVIPLIIIGYLPEWVQEIWQICNFKC